MLWLREIILLGGLGSTVHARGGTYVYPALRAESGGHGYAALVTWFGACQWGDATDSS